MELYVDAYYESLNHFGEELCGDKVEFIHNDDGFYAVLADGLGSGVKANILSTLTSRIISTMMADGARLRDCVETITDTLPVCKERGVAYSTFSIVRVTKTGLVTISEFDNPKMLHFRNGVLQEINREKSVIKGKTVYTSEFQGKLGDHIVCFSDGVVHAGVGSLLDLGWLYDSIVKFEVDNVKKDMSPRTITSDLLGAVNTLYMQKPGDDSTVMALHFKQASPATIMVGPPMDKTRDEEVVNKLIKSPGLKVVCGGTTSSIVSKYTGKEVDVQLDYQNPSIPPIAIMDGIDLVTEGVLTIRKALEILRTILSEGNIDKYLKKTDAASRLVKLVLEDATEVHFLVGRASCRERV